MTQIHVDLTDGERNRLAELARRSGKSEGAVVREALQPYLERLTSGQGISEELRSGWDEALSELHTVAAECSEPDWAGVPSQPVVDEVIDQASRLLEVFPRKFPAPVIGAEPDGDLTLEWYRSPERLLSISVSRTGLLHYAATIGSSKAYGTEPFHGNVPVTILEVLRRVMSDE